MEPAAIPPPTPDESQVKLLGIFSFVLAGTSALGLVFVYLHYTLIVFDNQHVWDQMQLQAAQRHQPVPPFNPAQFFHVFIWFYLLCAAWSIASLLANVAAGFFLLHSQARMFCLVVAGCNCINFPLGTILGVFSIVVLLRPAVITRFAFASAAR